MRLGRPGLRNVAQAWRTMIEAAREDHAMLRHYDGKYAPERTGRRPAFAHDFVTRIGFQMLVACRAMRFCVDAGLPLAPQVLSRAIRHAYGSDIHWEAELEPGIVFVHGMGLAVSRAAHIEHGAILFQNVTLGMSVDPVTREAGAPVIGRGAHIGAGTTVVGPIRIGARSKITANCLVRTSVPPDSLVEAPPPVVSPRAGALRHHGTEAGS